MTTSRTPSNDAAWGFGLRWTMATAVGWLVGFVICEAFKAFFRSISGDGAVIGTCVGIAQWLVIGPRISGSRWWIVASIIGFAVGKQVGDVYLSETGLGSAVAAGLVGAVIGVALGFFQWLVLRRHVAQAGWWIAASALAWAVGWIIVGAGGEAVYEVGGGTSASAYLIGTIGAAVAGAISGAALIWLFRTRPA